MSRREAGAADPGREDAAYRQVGSLIRGFDVAITTCQDTRTVRGPDCADGVIRLTRCAADLPAYRLVDLLLSCRTVVVHPCDREAPPGLPDGHDMIDRLAALVGPRLRRTAASDPVTPARLPEIVAGHEGIGRRGLLGLTGLTNREPPAARHAAHDDDGRLLESLRRVGVRAPAGPGPALVPPSRRLAATTACTACGMCVRTCPHDALDLVVDEGLARLVHHPAACRGDLACVAICPEDALSTAGPADWPSLLADLRTDLVELAVARCVRCHSPHPAADGELCRVCRMRRDNPFASFRPPTLPR